MFLLSYTLSNGEESTFNGDHTRWFYKTGLPLRTCMGENGTVVSTIKVGYASTVLHVRPKQSCKTQRAWPPLGLLSEN